MTAKLTDVSLTVDQAKIRQYAEITDDFNPIHLDAEFAARTPMKGVIAHGTMSMNLIWQAIAATFGTDAAVGAELDIRFIRPVRLGDVVTAGGEALSEGGGRFKVWVRNQAGDPVIEGMGTIPVRPVAGPAIRV